MEPTTKTNMGGEYKPTDVIKVIMGTEYRLWETKEGVPYVQIPNTGKFVPLAAFKTVSEVEQAQIKGKEIIDADREKMKAAREQTMAQVQKKEVDPEMVKRGQEIIMKGQLQKPQKPKESPEMIANRKRAAIAKNVQKPVEKAVKKADKKQGPAPIKYSPPAPKETSTAIVKSSPETEIIEGPELDITPRSGGGGFLTPACSIEEAVEAFKLFEKAKTAILSDKDVIWLGSDGRPCAKGVGMPHIKRPGWRKLGRFFGLSWRILKNIRSPEIGLDYLYKATAKVWNHAGESVEQSGIVTSKDPFFTKGGRKEANEEDVMMKAETVALNRAISDMLGSGEVSAEEMK